MRGMGQACGYTGAHMLTTFPELLHRVCRVTEQKASVAATPVLARPQYDQAEPFPLPHHHARARWFTQLAVPILYLHLDTSCTQRCMPRKRLV